MDDPSTTTATLDQAEADEDILTYTVSDEALEAAAGSVRGAAPHKTFSPCFPTFAISEAHCAI